MTSGKELSLEGNDVKMLEEAKAEVVVDLIKGPITECVSRSSKSSPRAIQKDRSRLRCHITKTPQPQAV